MDNTLRMSPSCYWGACAVLQTPILRILCAVIITDQKLLRNRLGSVVRMSPLSSYVGHMPT